MARKSLDPRIAELEARIARQEVLIAELDLAGRATTLARELWKALRETLAELQWPRSTQGPPTMSTHRDVAMPVLETPAKTPSRLAVREHSRWGCLEYALLAAAALAVLCGIMQVAGCGRSGSA